MSRKTIAPKLLEWIEAADRHGLEFHKPMKREVRAMLSVIRAAEGVRRYVQTRDYEEFVSPADKTLFRSLARLSRASRQGERR